MAVACIRRRDLEAYCSREVSPRDYLFQNPDYAVDHYDPRDKKHQHAPKQSLFACTACIDKVKVIRETEKNKV